MTNNNHSWFFFGILMGIAAASIIYMELLGENKMKALDAGVAEYYHSGPSSTRLEFRYITNYQVLSARTNK